jgi:hypothetical protein
MADVKVADVSIDGTRFVVDIVATKNANKKISASVVVAEIFPMEQFQPRIKEGEDAEALLTNIQYYTLLRLHEVVPARSHETLCLSVAADIGDKVLSKEYTERNDWQACGTLLAVCRQVDGSWDTSALAEVGTCVGDIGNMNGAFSCNRGPAFGSGRVEERREGLREQERRLRCEGIIDPIARERCFHGF